MSLGALIKDLRVARGWSQSRLADELCMLSGSSISREYISRNWESGKFEPSAFWLRHLSTALDTPLSVLEHESMKRRTFIADIAATAIAPRVAADLIQEGFSARLRGDGPSIEDWEAKLAAYGTDYMSMGAQDIQRRLASELVTLQQQLDQPRMWTVAARLMTLFAKTIPGSDGAKAISWYRMAAEAADRSGDTDTRVWVRGRASIALGYEGSSLGIADMFGDQAMAISDKPSLGRLNAVFGKAHAAALRGDLGTARALIDVGRRSFDTSGSYEQTSDYAVPWWRVNVFLSLLAARLGDERIAIAAQEAAVHELPSSLPRFATHLELHRGLMMARSGDPEGGERYAQAALDLLPPEKHSLTLRMLIDEIKRDESLPKC
ncbi:XRE family transcriptional regulator [Kribbella antibiotica]|uniref:XRE family transcriptional regulator n=1 Tax=Kribbella antibiotica TaxID=190195 RepID=A0A4R4ZUE4_9ACTN|nr:helix-turn-helix transcriptional regulator [Kribbella antibiotica]TDD61986.1 XRE family transcriptional regulator [Kribbella antibiotica]